jgi:hypothetical protein
MATTQVFLSRYAQRGGAGGGGLLVRRVGLFLSKSKGAAPTAATTTAAPAATQSTRIMLLPAATARPASLLLAAPSMRCRPPAVAGPGLPPLRTVFDAAHYAQSGLPVAAIADWEAGVAAMHKSGGGGSLGDAELALQRSLALLGREGGWLERPASLRPLARAAVANLYRDLARAQSMQGKEHAALQSLLRALTVVDGLPPDTPLLEAAEGRAAGGSIVAAAALQLGMKRVGEGMPPQLLLSILDNLVSHVAQLQGDGAPDGLRVRLALLGRAEAVRAQVSEPARAPARRW